MRTSAATGAMGRMTGTSGRMVVPSTPVPRTRAPKRRPHFSLAMTVAASLDGAPLLRGRTKGRRYMSASGFSSPLMDSADMSGARCTHMAAPDCSALALSSDTSAWSSRSSADDDSRAAACALTFARNDAEDADDSVSNGDADTHGSSD